MPCYKKQWEADRIDMQTPDGARSAWAVPAAPGSHEAPPVASCRAGPLPATALDGVEKERKSTPWAWIEGAGWMLHEMERSTRHRPCLLFNPLCREVDHVVTTKQLGAWLQREGIDYPKLGETSLWF